MGNTSFLVSLLVVLLLCNFMAALSMESPNITTDRLALLALKAHITQDPQNILATNWSTATSVCNWVGVSCGSRNLRVTALDISSLGLTGTIPPHLGNLSFLAWIAVGNNNFHGSLPVELSHLRRLKFINFVNNSFSGEIPSWFGSFTRLERLFLYGNNFGGVIPSSLCSLSRLEVLGLYSNNLNGQIPAEIGNFARLKYLYLDHNQLSGAIPSSIFNISSLEEIDLSNNQLSGEIPRAIGNHPRLITLDLGENQLSGSISSSIFNISSLQRIDLGSNQLSGSIQTIPTIPRNTSSLIRIGLDTNNLTDLSLSYNHLEGSIPTEIGNLTMLNGLYLGKNNLEGEIPWQLGNLTLLTDLDCASNKFTGRLPNEIGNLQHLQIFNMGPNNFTGFIPPSLFNSSTLRVISLAVNRLSGHLPFSSEFRLPKLEQIHLGGNELSGPIPISICNASQLTHIDLSSNSFSGYIPDRLGNLRYLQWLNLQYNNLTATGSSFLISLTSCRELNTLKFDGNPLINGKFLASIGNLSVSLQDFSASDCNIKGSIPGEIGNLNNLISLRLENNELTGKVPTTIGRLIKLQSISLGYNKLQGSIPSDFCQLESLYLLSLTGNKLSGPIPACLGDLVSLRYLLLGSNSFTGSIPSTLTRLLDILRLSLSSNSLNGSLPIDIGNLKAVAIINLSQNRLSGDIPTSLGDLKDLTSLSLSGNKLDGSIPESLGDMVSLEFLDLSRNNLSGMIPMSLEKLSYRKYFNVSFNRLQGEIPNKGQFTNYSFQSFLGNEGLCGAPRLRVMPCKSNLPRRSKTATKLMKYILPAIAATISIVSLIVIFSRSRKRNAKLPTDEENLQPLAAWRRISYQELAQATDGFCESKLLGIGSFGSVYQGTLSDGTNVAVKVFNLDLEGAFESFDVECEVLRNIRHRNLVKIISCCNIDFKALVLEFIPNGSLEKWLYSHNHFLNILQRLSIMIDVASALEYLHHGHTTPVVHCDLKPSNVLLDEDMVAHLGDFGIAKLLAEENSMIQTMTLATIGYMAPEYGSEGFVSTNGDVYSLGILLMETFTRKKPTNDMFEGKMSLKSWVQKLLPSTIIQVIDPNLLSTGNREDYAIEECALSVLQLALECSAELPEERVDMKEVVANLKKIKIKFLRMSNRFN
ncbi:PREDICTED: probable LRR receptor-like serine/threonine-protein kinase At3g47570 [Theobroma cacao]|uniref:non-specific serine/threonine protein kinase n=1 Tax=Theobroma cacao TaxID=3641 RepID=A0AB32WYI9_THECC|nr:PREDICTED: probable LRR receptor-like serine/threonine-protein kinase At3g47570 [Theobroma cacao]